MSRLPRGAAKADSRANSTIPRRQLVEHTPAVEMVPEPAAVADPAICACKVWLDLDAQANALVDRWQALEGCLFNKGFWGEGALSPCADLPEVQELRAIEANLGKLDQSKQELLAELCDISATSAEGVVLKLRVLANLVRREDSQQACALLIGVQGDLRTVLQ